MSPRNSPLGVPVGRLSPCFPWPTQGHLRARNQLGISSLRQHLPLWHAPCLGPEETPGIAPEGDAQMNIRTLTAVRRRSLSLMVALSLCGLGVMRVAVVSATELIPSVGLTRSVDSDEAKSLYGLALRSYIVPHTLQGEIQGQYRQEELYNGDLHLKTWPITASLYVAPVQQLYFGAGAGWYHNTFDYRDALNIPNKTTEQFGVHVGGGM